MTATEIRDLIEDTFKNKGLLKGTCWLREDLFNELMKDVASKSVFTSLYFFNTPKEQPVLENINEFSFMGYKIIKKQQQEKIILIHNVWLEPLYF